MRVGFTGTRVGLTKRQATTISELLQYLSADEFHHGMCIGADEQAHSIFASNNISIVGHPCTLTKFITKVTENYQKIHTAKPPLDRNIDIIKSCDILLACPKERYNVNRGSGTWYTIRAARKIAHSIIIVWP